MKRFIGDVKKFWNYTVYAIQSDLKAEVAGSFLSWMWWILDPLLYMLVYSFVAVFVFNSREPYFPVFVFIGLNVWQFFSKVVKSGVKLIQGKKSIVTKVYIPKFVFIFDRIGVFGIKMFISFALTTVFMIFYRVPVTWKALWVIPLFLLLFIITYAVTTIITHFGVFVEDLLNVITVVLQLGFYVSGIFYSIESRIMPKSEIIGTILINCNPIALIMTDMRNVLLYNGEPHYIALAVWAVVGIVVSAIGTRIIYKHENSYVKVI
ncbi:MAG: ABC transporter permease [Clostridia bacterium]|nr:ABC transporter permease [Clostridia bacterium]